MNFINKFSQKRELPYLILLGFLTGSNVVAARFILGQLEAPVFVTFRLIIVDICFLLIYRLSPKHPWPADKKIWFHGSIWGILGLAIPMTTFIAALHYLSSGVGSLLYTLSVVVTMILGQLFLGETNFSLRKLIGILIAFCGASLILIRGETGLAAFGQTDWRGYALVGVSLSSISFGYIYANKFLVDRKEIDVINVRIIAATIFLIPFTFFTVGFNISKLNYFGVLILLFAAIVGTLLTSLLEFIIIKRFGASKTSQATYITPVVASVLGAIFLGENITFTIIIGMAIIFLGIYLLNQK